MKKLLILLGILFVFTGHIWSDPSLPNEKPVLDIYSVDMKKNARQAVRLGNFNFQQRINTSQMTVTDTQIALLITTGFQPFFDKLNRLEDSPSLQAKELQKQYSEEFVKLIHKLSKLFLKSQGGYVNSLLLDEQAAAQETLLIVQEAVDKGHF